ncbi:sigma-54-dependent Fis family transcriptional regulator [Pseudoxanthomonas sp. CF125]|uniref:sigma-54-dependent Fis family transcriptional regulator n=1 Tax=Pseudoxanthomonas sp. CF125 TaxID=1855303 RepID=UPI000891547F|nr:sigma-54-dependent Fis family transcriptional regulator [Pseudoxanthomonas sp. CF125]SDQ59349.1 Transcriptional regulator of acetoin/glycerol metabolism [Pseudoxanthomonas sp. CF125]
MAQLTSKQRLGQARRTFFERGAAPVGQVPDTILQSWRRCQQLGLTAQNRPAMEPVPDLRLREMRERHEKLWRLARAELDGLRGDAVATGSIVLLTDDEGWILDAEGSTGFLDKAGRVALMPGACWSENRVGTNAIGTAIVEGRGVEVRGGEHYFDPHGILSCSAAPIFDPFGQLVGVLDISGDASVPQLHALGLARLAVANIEHRYFDDGIKGCELLRLHHAPALLGTAREGLLAFRGGRLVAANRVGLHLFGLERGDLGRTQYPQLFAEALTRLRDDGMLLDRQGRALHGRVDDDDSQRPKRPPTRAPITVSAAARGLGADAPLFDAALETDLQRACRVLNAGLPVLVQGETGTGKEVFARELHRRSARAGKPFVAVNCAALPEGLIEAELFGYEDGAFTGARRQGNPGLLRQADGGVLFLDEIGDMPLALQPRLLRVLQERELTPLGGGKPLKLDFALICATHRDLEEAIQAGRFRPDLFYRIAHHGVRIAPLREAGECTELVAALWQRIAAGRELDEAALARLAAYPWPGNLRQLAACLRTLVALSEPDQRIDVELLPAYLRCGERAGTTAPVPVPAAASAAGEAINDLDAITQTVMREALVMCHGNVAQAAKRLGISRSTLYRRLGSDPRGLDPRRLQ